MIKFCLHCNKKFLIEKDIVNRKKRTNYCSSYCARPILKKIELKCTYCQKLFHKYPSQVKSNKSTVFCGKQCVIYYRKIHWKGKIEKKCIECQKLFKIFICELKKSNGAGSFCSRKCQANGHEIRKCLVCNKQFKAHKSNIKRGLGKYCSQKCSGKANYKNKSCFQFLSAEQRFFLNISNEKHEKNCWIWTGLKNKAGYGRMRIKYSDFTSHRFSYELYNYNIPSGYLVCHKCDNTSCVNPDHLYLGTHKDNAIDKKMRNRENPCKGSNHHNAKLNEEYVKDIKNMLKDGFSIKEISYKYNVVYETILNIKIGKNWKHVNI